MRLRTITIGRHGFDLDNPTSGSPDGHGRAWTLAPADRAQEMVVVGDDAAQLIPIRDIRAATIMASGRPRATRAERDGRAR